MKDPDLARRTTGWRPSPTLAVMAEAARRRREGQDIIDFGPGEPDFATPAPIREAAKQALDRGQTHYTPTPGIPELRDALAERYRRRYDAPYRAENVVVGCGGKHLLWETFHALFEEGDEVLLPAPYWTSFPDQIAMAEARAVIVDTHPDSGFLPSIDRIGDAATDRTRGIVVNSPGNPTGGVWPAALLEEVASLALERGWWIVTDETYDRFLYDGAEHVSLASRRELGERLVVVNSFSKTYAMTGWRLGYALGPTEVMATVGRLQSQLTSGANSIAQYAGLAALRDEDGEVEAAVQEMIEAFARRRRIVLEVLARIEALEAVPPLGAFYVFPDARPAIREHGLQDDVDLCRMLIEEHGLAVVPGSAFGAPGWIRLSYALAEAELRRGLDRLAAAL